MNALSVKVTTLQSMPEDVNSLSALASNIFTKINSAITTTGMNEFFKTAEHLFSLSETDDSAQYPALGTLAKPLKAVLHSMMIESPVENAKEYVMRYPEDLSNATQSSQSAQDQITQSANYANIANVKLSSFNEIRNSIRDAWNDTNKYTQLEDQQKDLDKAIKTAETALESADTDFYQDARFKLSRMNNAILKLDDDRHVYIALVLEASASILDTFTTLTDIEEVLITARDDLESKNALLNQDLSTTGPAPDLEVVAQITKDLEEAITRAQLAETTTRQQVEDIKAIADQYPLGTVKKEMLSKLVDSAINAATETKKQCDTALGYKTSFYASMQAPLIKPILDAQKSAATATNILDKINSALTSLAEMKSLVSEIKTSAEDAAREYS